MSRHEELWADPVPRRTSMMGPVQFRFLNHLHSLPDTGGWEEDGLEKLWIYNLHYFDDLNARNSGKRTQWHRDLINRWITENEPGKGTGWDPYPASLRIVNWIKWALAGNSLDSEWLHSLAIQTRWLQRRLEWHLLGNHLFANAKALVFAGAFFEGPEADGWLKKGLRILNTEIPEQVLKDGGHFELSPMYHSIILEDTLDLLNLAQTWPEKFSKSIVDMWRDTAKKMLEWLAALTHPDGEIVLFNDAAFGIAGSLGSLRNYAARLNVQSQNYKERKVCNLAKSGYIRISQGNAMAFLDVASIGSDYIPGHAHADTLSFEFSLFDQRLLVNSGTSLYEQGAERLRQRGTAAHNTVQIDGENSSEVWASFRVAKRAHPIDLQIKQTDEFIEVRCSHDGYKRLSGKIIHQRVWRLFRDSFQVTDKVEGRFRKAIAFYHLHPDIDVVGERELKLPNEELIKYYVTGGLARIEKDTWHPEFGKTIESQCLKVEFESEVVSVKFTWC